MFCSTVRPSVSGGSCCSMPTVASGSMIASPLLGWSSPAMMRSSEDLPVPLGPTTPIFAPCRNDRVTLSRTTLSPWALRTLRSVNTYSAMIAKPTCAARDHRRRASSRSEVVSRRVRVRSDVPCDRWRAVRCAVRGGVGRHRLVAATFRPLDEVADAAREVVTDEARLHAEGGGAWPLVGSPGLRAQPAVHDHRVTLADRVADVVGKRAPCGHRVPGGLAVDPRPVLPEPRRHRDAEGCDADVLRGPVPYVAAGPAVEGHKGLVHRHTPREARSLSRQRR